MLGHAAVLAYPSLDEGFGFPLLEAMQLGVPVVAADAGSIPEVAGRRRPARRPRRPGALAAALAIAIGDDEVRARLVAAGTARLAAFSWASERRRLHRPLP